MPYQIYHAVASCALLSVSKIKAPYATDSLLRRRRRRLLPAEKHKARKQISSSAAADEWEKHFSEIFRNKSVRESASNLYFNLALFSVSND